METGTEIREGQGKLRRSPYLETDSVMWRRSPYVETGFVIEECQGKWGISL